MVMGWNEEPTSAEDHEDIAEQGVCEVCGRSYRKTTSESNLSRTGQCLDCGWNP